MTRELPSATREWTCFPDSEVPVRIGSDRKFDAGVFPRIVAPCVVVYILVQELPCDANGNADHEALRLMLESMTSQGKVPPSEIFVSEGPLQCSTTKSSCTLQSLSMWGDAS